MSNISVNDTLDTSDFERKTLPSGLNILTILSFIGCAIQFLGSIWGFYSARTNYEQKDKMMEQLNSEKAPGWAKSLMPDEETLIKSFENRLPILILGMVSVFLCFYGLLQMRKLKKQGYLLYVIGEILPFISMVLFIGTLSVTSLGVVISAAIAVLFIVMYTLYRKNLIY